MSNLSTLINWAATQSEDVLGKALATLGIALTASHDTPDEHGRVALTGLPAGHPYADWRFAIREVGLTLQGNARIECMTNVVNADRNMLFGWFSVCYPVVEGVDSITGNPTYNVDPSKPQPKTIAMPSSYTVESATAYIAAKTVSSGDQSGFIPH